LYKLQCLLSGVKGDFAGIHVLGYGTAWNTGLKAAVAAQA
jgi:hypothetical protein